MKYPCRFFPMSRKVGTSCIKSISSLFEKEVSMRRVVVTGMGLLSPMGRGVETTWQGLIQGKSAITPVTRYDVSESPAKIAGQIPFGTAEGQFDPDSVMAPKEQRRVDPFILYGIP